MHISTTWRVLKDVLLIGLVVPVFAAIIYAIIMAYKTFHPPRAAMRHHPDKFGLPATAVKIPVRNSRVVIDAWCIPAPGAAHTVVVGHGIGRNKSAALPYAALLHRAGYNVVAFDHRNHGESSNDWSFRPMSRRFTDDIAAVIDFVRSRPELNGGQIALYAFSFSTFPAIYVLTRPECRLQAIICDSGPVKHILPLYERFIATNQLLMPAIFKGPIVYQVVKIAYTYISDAMLAVQNWPPALTDLPVQLLFIANECDSLIPADEVRQVADLYPQATFWLAPMAPHLQAFRMHKAVYADVVTGFLQRALDSVPYTESA